MWEKVNVHIVGSNPSAVSWMDIFSHCFEVKIYCLFVEKTKINENRGQDGQFFKKKTKKNLQQMHGNIADIFGTIRFFIYLCQVKSSMDEVRYKNIERNSVDKDRSCTLG